MKFLARFLPTLLILQPTPLMLAPEPPPTHVEWRYFPVERMVLLNPTKRNVDGNPEWIVLPPGALLSIPTPAPGPDPNTGGI